MLLAPIYSTPWHWAMQKLMFTVRQLKDSVPVLPTPFTMDTSCWKSPRQQLDYAFMQILEPSLVTSSLEETASFPDLQGDLEDLYDQSIDMTYYGVALHIRNAIFFLDARERYDAPAQSSSSTFVAGLNVPAVVVPYTTTSPISQSSRSGHSLPTATKYRRSSTICRKSRLLIRTNAVLTSV